MKCHVVYSESVDNFMYFCPISKGSGITQGGLERWAGMEDNEIVCVIYFVNVEKSICSIVFSKVISFTLTCKNHLAEVTRMPTVKVRKRNRTLHLAWLHYTAWLRT